jgi:hypothetical protein
MRVKAAFGICVHVEFNLAYTLIELNREGGMDVLETVVGIWLFGLPDFGFVRRNASMIAIVGANNLDLVDANLPCIAGSISLSDCQG